MQFDPNLEIGQVINNHQLVERFKCSPQGGMRRSKRTNSLVLVSDRTKLYHDKKMGDIFYYTGMGQKGDQSLSYMQNRTLAESNNNGVSVYFFEVNKPTQYTFMGQVTLDGDPYQEKQYDQDGLERNVWVFPLRVVKSSTPQLVKEVNEIENILSQVNELTHTEKESLIKARIGQSLFKKSLLSKQQQCRLCGITDIRFLIASHIKPWSESTNQERLDSSNGLLLCPNHDAAFDKGLISFDDNGNILISSSLSKTDQVFLNLTGETRIQLTDKEREYMEWHRGNLYKKVFY